MIKMCDLIVGLITENQNICDASGIVFASKPGKEMFLIDGTRLDAKFFLEKIYITKSKIIFPLIPDL